jgi:hypothetical protein
MGHGRDLSHGNFLFSTEKNVVFKLWDWEKRGKFMKTK